MTRPAPAAAGQRWPFLPALLFEMAEAFGLEAALAFAKRFGGTYVHVPLKPSRENEVGAEFPDILAWLIERYAGERVIVPRGPDADAMQRRAAILKLTEEGYGANKIARTLGCHIRWIYMERAAARATEHAAAQVDLFGGLNTKRG